MKTEKLVAALILMPVLFGLYLSFFQKKFFEDVYTREDGVIEWITVVALLMGCFLCLKRLWRSFGKRPQVFLMTTSVLALLYFFGAGEEISWGQRILGIESSDFFEHNNSQGEINLHNLIVGGVKINKLVFGTILAVSIIFYLAVWPVLYRKKASIRSFTDRWGIPVPQNYQISAYLLLFALVSLMPSHKRFEVMEYGGCLIFLLITWRPLNQAAFFSGSENN